MPQQEGADAADPVHAKAQGRPQLGVVEGRTGDVEADILHHRGGDVRIAAAAVKDGRAAVEPGLDLLGDLLVVFGDDERDGGMVQPVEQLIHDDRRDRQR